MPKFPELNRDKALVFRIIHRDNVPWILNHGLQCQSSELRDPNYVTIGQSELIEKRRARTVPVHPGGTLSDYVPFYFTPRSPMLLNILTGRGVRQREPHEIVVIVVPLRKLIEVGTSFVLTDGHAYMRETHFHGDLAALDRIDWDILQRSDYRRSDEDPGKMNRYQAEALVHGALHLDGIGGLACYDDAGKDALARAVDKCGLEIKVFKQPSWYDR